MGSGVEWQPSKVGRCTIALPTIVCDQQAVVYNTKEREHYCVYHLIEELKSRLSYRFDELLEDFHG